MFEERTGQQAEQCVILVVTEEGLVQSLSNKEMIIYHC